MSTPKSPRLRASVFHEAARAQTPDRHDFSCCRVEGETDRVGVRNQNDEVRFYERLFAAPAIDALPACFSAGGAVDGLPLAEEEIYTVRLIALTLAGLLVSEGFYLDAK